jgi:hypothetical protein
MKNDKYHEQDSDDVQFWLFWQWSIGFANVSSVYAAYTRQTWANWAAATVCG